ncbi:DUF418 domain-containing protein [Evansella cellulosilytica]|uniref:DUF418 domain-containing protein n=1 Tax=Evansella cellulosilytica (strain ATCC 21833 / DSM 2522 / FERM P-1141 / JCM 9156 / N-4) TaxID=649639 RepID=E6TWP6_EVAC2|nr:DUF418 domain-containing protein [Evansella cellulosilytica]ADU28729.1 protein of unknown function DUF418 [Evansella cellulosilytica DSM 2522]
MEQQTQQNKPKVEMTPLDSNKRLNHIDSLRGFALLGILLVNMFAFQYGTFGMELIPPVLTSNIDQVTYTFISWFFQGSFYPIFSMLFGFGAIMIWERSQERERPFYLLFVRRLLILMVMGFVHLYFIWDGDILLTYAITGFLFIFFVNRKAKTLLIWAIAIAALINLPGLLPGDDEAIVTFDSYVEYERDVLGNGTYGDIVHHRFTASPFEKIDYGIELSALEREIMAIVMTVFNFITMITQTLLLFLVGGYLAKKRWVHHPNDHKSTLMKIAFIAIILGLIIKAGNVFTTNESLEYFGYILGGPLLGLGYIAAFCLLFNKIGETKIFKGFGYVGRMALSNYLAQSIVMTTIFYGYGFGLLGKLGTFIGVLLALALFLIQMFISRLWLKRNQFGPMEWFWRVGTYLSIPKMKK